ARGRAQHPDRRRRARGPDGGPHRRLSQRAAHPAARRRRAARRPRRRGQRGEGRGPRGQPPDPHPRPRARLRRVGAAPGGSMSGGAGEVTLSPTDFDRYRAIVRQRAGIEIPDARKTELEKGVAAALEVTGASDPGALYELLAEKGTRGTAAF